MNQLPLFDNETRARVNPFRQGLLKWIGNKQRIAHTIVSYFPATFRTYHEPFVGSGAVLATLAPEAAFASDTFMPLIEIWKALKERPEALKRWYADRWNRMANGDKVKEYERIKASYNGGPNAADLLFLCRSCYGGVVRFRKADGYMSTPCGSHDPISPQSFNCRVDEWYRRTRNCTFDCVDFAEAMARAKAGDIVYCDPPYSHSQSILYGAQSFSLDSLFQSIENCKRRGVYVALSIDGMKKSGAHLCSIPIPDGLFERTAFIDLGRSMLRRFQMNGKSLESEGVADRLLLTY